VTDAAPPEQTDTSQQAGLGPLNYDELPGLEDVVLEDSFVREVVETPDGLRFVLTAALKRTHPFWQPPRSNERHCFKPAMLAFHDAQVRWSRRGNARFTDVDGAVDLGNIDRLVAPPEGGYHIEGDFGVVDVLRSRAPVFTIVGASPEDRAYLREALAAWVRNAPPPDAPAPKPGDGTHDHEHGHDHAHGHGQGHDHGHAHR
jgi:hypothetical protein